MYDQSFNSVSLAKMLRKSDFFDLPRLKSITFKESVVESSVNCSDNGFGGIDFLETTKFRKKIVCRVSNFSYELVLRKIDRNLKRSIFATATSRDSIIANIKNMLSEGVQYRVYRLDIKSFYESFEVDNVIEKLSDIKKLSAQTKKMIVELLMSYRDSGGLGLPRGLSLSATISDFMMRSVDESMSQHAEVFYYSRYVDDVIVITSGNENPKIFIRSLTKLLPVGLLLNKRKEQICFVADSKVFRTTGAGSCSSPILLSFEYLGYFFSVHDPLEKGRFRDVYLDIADSKVNKIKTRLTRAIISYCKNRDFNLLETRVRFLTTNFSVLDVNKSSYRLAGIYHNYHRVDASVSKALPALDEYLRRATLSSYGKVFNEFFIHTSAAQRRKLLKYSFLRGFEEKTYTYFSSQQFGRIQECWKYA